ncbi:MAG TPA: hypothetical protein VFZ25_11480 [Chloroflexota bacterium]|nr:hypothetical protein [Chloroflexota bacterium]
MADETTADAARILAELGRLADERGWDRVRAALVGIRGADPRQVIVATPSGVDPAPLQRWISRVSPGASLQTVALEALAEDPLPALAAERVLAFLACGQLLEARAVAALSEAILSRPRDTYAVVYGGAERISDAEELDLVERGARRLLDADYGGAPAASLLDERVYLWSAGVPLAFLAKRLATDTDQLASWLSEVPTESAALASARLLYAINLADEQTATTAFSVRDAEVREQRVRHVRDSLAELRRRLLRRLESESGLIQRQLNASLQTLEADLLRGLRPYLESRLATLAPRADAEFLRSLVVDYLREGTDAWQARTLSSLTAQSTDTLSNTRTLLDGIDWPLVNEVVTGNGSQRTYPDALASHLAAEARVTLPEDVAEEIDAFHSRREAVSLADAARVAFAGSAVAATTWYLTGAQAIAIIAAGASAVVAGGILNVRLHRGQLLAELEPWARSEIKTVVRHAADRVQESAPRAIDAMRARLDGEIRELEAVLDDALARLRARPSEAPTGDRERIEDLRQAALALADSIPSGEEKR